MNHPIATTMNPFFNQYLAAEKGLATNTILAYRDALKLLFCFAAEALKKSVDDLILEDLHEKRILSFLDHGETSRGWTARTRNARLAAIRTYFRFITREEPSLMLQCQRIRAIPNKRTEHKTIEHMEENETKAFLDSVSPDERNGIRDQALLLLLYNTGARASEVAELNIIDLRLDANGQVKLIGKGRKQRSCPLWPETVEAIQAYIEVRQPRNPQDDALFFNSNGERITRFGIRYIVKKHAARAEEKEPSLKERNVTTHTIRHSTAMHLLRSGNDVNTVSYWLGHAGINTTHIYIEIDMQMKREMLDKTQAPELKENSPWHQPRLLEWLRTLSAQPQLCEAI
ncbi:MAG: tyrosine-type recombinase/integrase [Planctomycetota bacterium]|jgi:site-specific recombinase XerD|nr:tyrosine-type recombinase/integrase [Planctomycetota bacterium]